MFKAAVTPTLTSDCCIGGSILRPDSKEARNGAGWKRLGGIAKFKPFVRTDISAFDSVAEERL
jgi:hypothetical protein